MEELIQTRLTRVESDVKHVIEIVTDVKVELRRTNDKIDGMNKTLSDRIESVNKTLSDRIESVNKTLTDKIEGVNKTLTDKIEGVNKTLSDKIEGVNKTLSDKIDGVNNTLTEKIDGLKDKFDDLKGEMASMKVWAIGLYVALAASLLFVMAKGFHWL